MAVLNAAYDLLTVDDEATAIWTRLAGSDPHCSDDAIKHLIRLRFGEKVASPDPSDTEAMKRFQSQGGTIVVGLNKGQWANVKRAGAVLPAGKICPTPKPYSDDPDAEATEIVPPSAWTEGMKNIVEYAKFLGKELMGIGIVVRVVRAGTNFLACYGHGRLDLNLRDSGRRLVRAGSDRGRGQAPDPRVRPPVFRRSPVGRLPRSAVPARRSNEAAGAGEARRATSVRSEMMMEGNLSLDDCPATDGWSDRQGVFLGIVPS